MFSPEQIRLIRRAADGGRGAVLGEAAPAADNFPNRLAAMLRQTADAPVDLVLPADHAVFTRARSRATGDVRAALSALCGERARDMVWDAAPAPDGDGVMLAAADQDTVREARIYARDWGFNPAAVTAEHDEYPGNGPKFGSARLGGAAQAEEENVVDPEPAVEAPRARGPRRAAVAAVGLVLVAALIAFILLGREDPVAPLTAAAPDTLGAAPQTADAPTPPDVAGPVGPPRMAAPVGDRLPPVRVGPSVDAAPTADTDPASSLADAPPEDAAPPVAAAAPPVAAPQPPPAAAPSSDDLAAALPQSVSATEPAGPAAPPPRARPAPPVAPPTPDGPAAAAPPARPSRIPPPAPVAPRTAPRESRPRAAAPGQGAAATATQRDALALSAPSLLGVTLSDGSWSAIFRLPDGAVRKVRRGQSVGAWNVVSISADSVRVRGGGASKLLTVGGR